MAIPGIVGTATGGSSVANVAINVTPPAGAASWLAFLCWDTGQPAVNAPAGWSQVAVHDRDVVRLQVFYADPSTSPGTSWTSTSGHPRALVVVGFDGPVTVVGSTFANSATAPTRTAGSAALIGRVVADMNDSDAALAYPAAATLGRQQLVSWSELGWAASVAVAFQNQAAAGATGTAAFTVPASWMPIAGTLELTVPDAGGPTLESTGLAEVRVVGVGTSRALLTSTGLAELRVAASATSSTVRSVAGGASSTVSVGVATATTRGTAGDGTTATTGVAVTGTVRTTAGTATALATATAATSTDEHEVHTTTGTAGVVTAAAAATDTTRVGDVAARVTVSGGGDTGTDRVTDGTATATTAAHALTTTEHVRVTRGTATAHTAGEAAATTERRTAKVATAQATAYATSGTLRGVRATATATPSAYATTSTLRATQATAAATATSRAHTQVGDPVRVVLTVLSGPNRWQPAITGPGMGSLNPTGPHTRPLVADLEEDPA